MTDFDEFQGTYKQSLDESIRFSGKDSGFFTRSKAESLLDAAARHLSSTAGLCALDLGCGPGETDLHLTPHFKKVCGVDVSEGMLAEARKANPAAEYRHYDGVRIPYADATFDVVFAICVFHHILPGERESVVKEMRRVTRPGGMVFIFEHNPLNPVTVRVVNNCPFDKDAVLLGMGEAKALLRSAGLEPIENRFILFFPWEGRAFRRAESWISFVPLGSQYYAAGRA